MHELVADGRIQLGKTIEESFPELVDTPMPTLFKSVCVSGRPHVSDKTRLMLDGASSRSQPLATAQAGLSDGQPDDLVLVDTQMTESRPYDLVPMDMQMPSIDGLQAMRTIRSRCGYAVPIIAMTRMRSSKIAMAASRPA